MRMTVLRSAAAVSVANIVIATAAIALDQSLPAYHPVGALLGHITSIGSDTLGREMESWAKAFRNLYPDVKIEVDAAGSATAPAALLEGRSQFGPVSRPMTAEEFRRIPRKVRLQGFQVPGRG